MSSSLAERGCAVWDRRLPRADAALIDPPRARMHTAQRGGMREEEEEEEEDGWRRTGQRLERKY